MRAHQVGRVAARVRRGADPARGANARGYEPRAAHLRRAHRRGDHGADEHGRLPREGLGPRRLPQDLKPGGAAGGGGGERDAHGGDGRARRDLGRALRGPPHGPRHRHRVPPALQPAAQRPRGHRAPPAAHGRHRSVPVQAGKRLPRVHRARGRALRGEDARDGRDAGGSGHQRRAADGHQRPDAGEESARVEGDCGGVARLWEGDPVREDERQVRHGARVYGRRAAPARGGWFADRACGEGVHGGREADPR
mmetsp:Transcript_50622/g.120565  ORF Transcript_50622/g.120565 Transcript_50622/m.120565 type:complete len:252 (+) Transcript_50622:591-1346(+)